MEISDVAQAKSGQGEPVRRPGFGVAVDRHKLRALREEVFLERIDLSNLSRTIHLRQIASQHDIPGYPVMEAGELRAALTAKGITLPRHVGVSRDCIAKIENGHRAQPKISTVGIIIDTLNTELARRGREPVGIEAVYAEKHDGDGSPRR